ncbi:segregation/condensation protein A [Roseomonas sp. SSH11]|uniref:Segregation and condensation protein A n=1 Tax=Pararoseomonas baculiformis TaxID=2820812 RepID=A0ABS4ALD8_9PROT|nr:segregation/condensation protein A [Pararoseomonas baculiformis]MBP0447826.1 segregation/condensation protein A [Pararoseomonas baculiformis]
MAEAQAAAGAEAASWEGEGRGAQSGSAPLHLAPRLSVDGFEGPLDFLLEMVRRQRVDLGRLSILTLTDQLVGAIESGEGRIPLERRAEWLVMASRLLLLKAQLLAPASQEEAEAAEAAAARRLEQLDELSRMRAGADWLAARPQLGRGVFGRGGSTPAQARPQAELYLDFLEATLAMLEGGAGQAAEPAPTYRPRPPELWRIPDALRRIAELLQENPAYLPLERCLPPIPHHAPDRPIRLRAALASTFAAGLEMARDRRVALGQKEPFGLVTLAPLSSEPVIDA